ncbi:hypothetical protein ABBQ38_008013 [Trebouxia sp. C0009 RCD-2024]
MGNLKRRLPGHSSLSSGVTDRSDSSPGPGVSDDVTSNSDHAVLCTTSDSGQRQVLRGYSKMALSMLKIPAICMQSHRSQREAFSSAFTAGAAFNPPGSAEQPDRFPIRSGTSRADNLPQHGGWSLWRSIKQSFSDVPTESSRAGIKSKGFEPLGILSKAASGIASTTTTMATTLDEAMENFFEGWTPAPPAADHTPFHSSYHRYQSHSTAAHQSTGKMHEEAAAAPSSQKHGVNDDWEEWESPFHSKSASPNMENQNPNDSDQARTGISAWHGCSPDRGHREEQPVAMRGTTGGQRYRSSIEDPSLHALPRMGEDAYLQAANVQASGHDSSQESSQQLQLAAKTAEKAKQRVVQLQGKLQACDASPGTLSRLRHGLYSTQEVANALDEVALASQQCALLSQQHEATPSNPEPVVDQVSAQLQALLAEKARLAQENARLARENTGLQELLQYTMDQHLRDAEPVQAEASEDLEEWAALATLSPQRAASPASQKGSPVQTDPSIRSDVILNAAE